MMDFKMVAPSLVTVISPVGLDICNGKGNEARTNKSMTKAYELNQLLLTTGNKRTDCKILSMPLGPRVVFTRSAMAIAPMKEERRAFSP